MPILWPTVIFTLDVANLRYNVTMLSSQAGNITPTNKPMITRNALEFANPANPSLSFSYYNSNGGFNPNQKYIIEEILITRRIPDMMRK